MKIQLNGFQNTDEVLLTAEIDLETDRKVQKRKEKYRNGQKCIEVNDDDR